MKPHMLYRFYDATDVLLYVGITVNPGQRWANHREEKAWWFDVATVRAQVFDTREAVLDAEREAIIDEKPLHNVIHNRPSPVKTPTPTAVEAPRTVGASRPYDEAGNLWTFSTRNGHPRTVPLHYHWEVSCTSMSDEWLPDEISAYDLLRMWARKYAEPVVSIYWTLAPVHETAPFQGHMPWADGRSFLTYYTWPISAHTGERINFNRVPVLDLGWNEQASDKGGFFQEATSWKPAPLEGYVNLAQVFDAAGINIPLLSATTEETTS